MPKAVSSAICHAGELATEEACLLFVQLLSVEKIQINKISSQNKK